MLKGDLLGLCVSLIVDDIFVFLVALVGGAPSTITAAQPQQIAIWSDSDDEGQYYSPPQKLQVGTSYSSSSRRKG